MCVVYRYYDLEKNETVYIGIITSKSKKRCLEDRLKEHKRDVWSHGKFRIDYFLVKSKTDAELFEAHLIALYKTYNYFNKAKADWGLSDYLPTRIRWKEYIKYDGDFSQEINRRKSEFNHIRNFVKCEKHKFSIWYNEKEDRWYSQLPDETKPNGRRKIKRKHREDLDAVINDFYEAQERKLIEEMI